MTLVREIVRMTTINFIYCAYNDTTQYTSKATQVSLKLAVKRIGVNLKSPHLGHTNYIEANRRVEKKGYIEEKPHTTNSNRKCYHKGTRLLSGNAFVLY